MASRELITLYSILILRILTLLACVASIVLIVTNNFEISGFEKTKFTYVIAFRYVLASGAIGFLYALIQIPFAFYHANTQKRWIRDGYLSHFDFFGDKIVSLVLASGVGVGFGTSFELKRLINILFELLEVIGVPLFEVDEGKSKTIKYLNRGILSTAFLLKAFTCMLALTILTSMARRK